MCDFNWTSARVALSSLRVLFFWCYRQVYGQDEKANVVVGPSFARVRASKSGIEHLGYRSVCLNATRCFGQVSRKIAEHMEPACIVLRVNRV